MTVVVGWVVGRLVRRRVRRRRLRPAWLEPGIEPAVAAVLGHRLFLRRCWFRGVASVFVFVVVVVVVVAVARFCASLQGVRLIEVGIRGGGTEGDGSLGCLRLGVEWVGAGIAERRGLRFGLARGVLRVRGRVALGKGFGST